MIRITHNPGMAVTLLVVLFLAAFFVGFVLWIVAEAFERRRVRKAIEKISQGRHD